MFIDLRFISILVLGSLVFGPPRILTASAPLEEARLTRLVGDVRFTGEKTIVPVANRVLSDGSLKVGEKSRAEITFRDQTLVRIGDKSVFGFQSRNRAFELTSGAILAQVPEGVGGTRIQAGEITAVLTGTTMLVEHYPNGYLKFILLDGSSRICLKKPGHLADCMVLRAGQMLIASPTPKGLPDAADVDLSRLLETCHLISDFPVLPGRPRLVRTAERQRQRKSHGAFVDTHLVIHGRGTVVSVTHPDGAGESKNSTPSPTPVQPPATTAKPSP